MSRHLNFSGDAYKQLNALAQDFRERRKLYVGQRANAVLANPIYKFSSGFGDKRNILHVERAPDFDATSAVIFDMRLSGRHLCLKPVLRLDDEEHAKFRKEAGSPVTIFPGGPVSNTLRVDLVRLGGNLTTEQYLTYSPHKHNVATLNFSIFGEYDLWRMDPTAVDEVMKTGMANGWTNHEEDDHVHVGSHEYHAALVPAGSFDRDVVIAIVQEGAVLHGRTDGRTDIVPAHELSKNYYEGYQRGPHGKGLILEGPSGNR